MSKTPLLALAVAAVVLAAGEMKMTVDQLVGFVKSSITMKYPDRQVADYLKRVKLSNKLEDRTIEQLQGMGAGPKTVAALHDLRDGSNALPPPPPVVEQPKAPEIPPPDSIEQGRILSAVRNYAINYTKQLPNYLCARVTKRYVDTGNGNWRSMDKITTRVSYNEGHEDYKVILVNDQPMTDTPLEKLGGTISQGEFATMMLDIFREESKARFDWDHWATLRSRRCAVFSYDIEQVNSQYHILADRTQEYVPAYRGLLYVDVENNHVIRIVMTPYGIPATFPIQNVKTVLDYDYIEISDQKFLLPKRSEVTSKSGRYATRNEDSFVMYRKFGTDSTIKFDTADSVPDEKEKPIKP